MHILKQPHLTAACFYTMIKSRDPENLRALETHLKAVPWKFELEFHMVVGFLIVV